MRAGLLKRVVGLRELLGKSDGTSFVKSRDFVWSGASGRGVESRTPLRGRSEA